MDKQYEIDFLIDMIKKIFPWVDNIETTTKRVAYGTTFNDIKAGDQVTRDIIKLYFNYDNPKYLELRGKSISGKQVKQTFYDFLKKYLDYDPARYGAPIELEFYEVGPKKF